MKLQIALWDRLDSLESELILSGHLQSNIGLRRMLSMTNGKAWIDDKNNEIDPRTLKVIMDEIKLIIETHQ